MLFILIVFVDILKFYMLEILINLYGIVQIYFYIAINHLLYDRMVQPIHKLSILSPDRWVYIDLIPGLSINNGMKQIHRASLAIALANAF